MLRGELRALMRKIEVVENAEFTQAFERHPPEHRTRVTVVTGNGERLVERRGERLRPDGRRQLMQPPVRRPAPRAHRTDSRERGTREGPAASR